MAYTSLLGPPHLRQPLPPTTSAASVPSVISGDPLLDLMDSDFNVPELPYHLMGRTENNSATYISSGNPNLDFFFQVVPTTPSATVTDLLSKSWSHNPLTALKLVCNLRGVRGTGKSDKERFYSCALWMHSYHPKTLALNVSSFAEFGYMKDLLEILYRLLNGSETRILDKQNEDVQHRVMYGGRGRGRGRGRRRGRVVGGRVVYGRENLISWNVNADGGRKVETREERLADQMGKMKIDSEKAKELRWSKRAEMAVKAVERYKKDADFRFLHERVSEFFAGMLSSDAEMLKLGKLNKIGLAAKWCPSLDSSFDKSILLCESIARKMWPKDTVDEYKDIEEEHYVYRVRDKLRREVLVPIRKVLELPEVYMSAGKWDSLPYNRVASVAMKNYTKIFKKHDLERFDGYLTKVKEGKAKIAAGALLPHEILASTNNEETRDVAELQWDRMVKDLLEKGKLKNCIAVCDVSGSMNGTPMEVCIALGMLLSELSEEPWKGRVITFSANPQLHIIKGDTITEKMEFVRRMDWGMNTNFQRVFDRILEVAKNGNLSKDGMIKRVFVFSDMEFVCI